MAVLMATSDFHLVELNNEPPYDYGLFAAGWNSSNTVSSSGVGIHHPAGDIKKISKYNQQLVQDMIGESDGLQQIMVMELLKAVLQEVLY